MAQIKITDLSEKQKISKEDMKKIRAGSTYSTYTISNPLVTSYRFGGSSQGGETPPTENVTLNFDNITVNYDNYGKDSGGNADFDFNTDDSV